jgi:hypothetical protein
MLGPLTALACTVAALADPGGTALLSRESFFPFDDDERLAAGEKNAGKLWRSHGLPDDGAAVPLIVFVHGVIGDGQRHHWLTTDPAGPWDARPFLSDLVDRGEVEPLVAAVPSHTKDGSDPEHLFDDLDFDRFVSAVDATLAPFQRVDRGRVVVVGHSASACGTRGGAFRVLDAQTLRARALFALDGCLSRRDAEVLATAIHVDDLFVGYQSDVWLDRDFEAFRETWARLNGGAKATGSRVLERFSFVAGETKNPHLEIVELAIRRWLPRVLPPPRHGGWVAALDRARRPEPALDPLVTASR